MFARYDRTRHFSTICMANSIFGDPGQLEGREKIGAKKSQERGEGLFSLFLAFLRPNLFLARLNFFPPPLTAPGSPRS